MDASRWELSGGIFSTADFNSRVFVLVVNTTEIYHSEKQVKIHKHWKGRKAIMREHAERNTASNFPVSLTINYM